MAVVTPIKITMDFQYKNIQKYLEIMMNLIF
jgi:hypothetical protein